MISLVKRALGVCVLALVLAAAGPAQAQWIDGNGQIRFGAFIQGMMVDFDAQATNTAVAPPAVTTQGVSASGVAFGASFGYDWLLPNYMVLGLEVDASIGDNAGTYAGGNLNVDYMATARGRLGVFVRPGWLLYATAGAAWLGVEHDLKNALVSQRDNMQTLAGWTAGVGTEVNWHHVILFAEYMHAGFGNFEFNVGPVRHDIDVNVDVIRAGIKFRIGHDYYRDDVRERLK